MTIIQDIYLKRTELIMDREQFGPGYRFHFFPSVAVGWFVSNEKFFHFDWINRLKLRYSIGMVGDDQV